MPTFRAFALAFAVATTLPTASVLAQAPTKTPLQQASPIIDTLAARLNKLVRDVDAAGADLPKVRGLAEKQRADNERLETQLATLKAAMSEAEKAELEVYTQLKFGKSPDKLKTVLDKANKEAAEIAAKVGPATVAKYREQIAKLGDEGPEHVKRIRDAGSDGQKRDQAWQKLLAWDTKRHALAAAIRHDANVMEPKVLTDELDTATQADADHATRLYRLGGQPACAELQKELAAAEARAAHVLDAWKQAEGASGGKRAMAMAKVEELRAAALTVQNPELTQDEVEEVLDTVRAALRKVSK